jgi:hypothetical protein
VTASTGASTELAGATKYQLSRGGRPIVSSERIHDVDNRHQRTIVSITDIMSSIPSLLPRTLDQLIVRSPWIGVPIALA